MDTTALKCVQGALRCALEEYAACPTPVYRAKVDAMREVETDILDVLTESVTTVIEDVEPINEVYTRDGRII